MRFHVVALPHTQTTSAFSACAYTNKVVGFCKMMMARGHEVFLYAGEQNDAPCTELITCVSETKRAEIVGDKPYVEASFDYLLPHWQTFNYRAIAGIIERRQPHDFLCLIGGLAQKQVADALPGMTAVEWGVGYGGVFAPYRVFESYAWMHTHYGAAARSPTDGDGKWYDAVIPGYLDPADFPFKGDQPAQAKPYYLFIGRLVERKGFQIAIDACNALGAHLVLAGPGAPPAGADYRGVVGPVERGRLMAGATAVFVPTRYIEPFGNVAIEAMACGTPVITTDWGAFTETVVDGVTGFRCHTLREFVDAAKRAPELDSSVIRKHVVERYSLEVVGAKYERYFKRLDGLWGIGWHDLSGVEAEPAHLGAPVKSRRRAKTSSSSRP